MRVATMTVLIGAWSKIIDATPEGGAAECVFNGVRRWIPRTEAYGRRSDLMEDRDDLLMTMSRRDQTRLMRQAGRSFRRLTNAQFDKLAAQMMADLRPPRQD